MYFLKTKLSEKVSICLCYEKLHSFQITSAFPILKSDFVEFMFNCTVTDGKEELIDIAQVLSSAGTCFPPSPFHYISGHGWPHSLGAFSFYMGAAFSA